MYPRFLMSSSEAALALLGHAGSINRATANEARDIRGPSANERRVLKRAVIVRLPLNTPAWIVALRILVTTAQSSRGNATTLTSRQSLARQAVTQNTIAREAPVT